MDEPPPPVTVIILSRNRPIYLWVCLDSLYRYTRHPARFVLVDNHSDDPQVRQVAAGFERRGFFDEVRWHFTNSPTRVADAIAEFRSSPGDYLVIVESDVAVFASTPCWLSRMTALMDANPCLGLLGSYLDTSDFVDPAAVRHLAPNLDDRAFQRLVKAGSSERKLPKKQPTEEIIDPFNPPGRLVMIRKSIIDAIPFGTDTFVYQQAKAAGIGAGIATRVYHRHLSLLNIYDYPDYDLKARDEFQSVNWNGIPTPSRDP